MTADRRASSTSGESFARTAPQVAALPGSAGPRWILGFGQRCGRRSAQARRKRPARLASGRIPAAVLRGRGHPLDGPDPAEQAPGHGHADAHGQLLRRGRALRCLRPGLAAGLVLQRHHRPGLLGGGHPFDHPAAAPAAGAGAAGLPERGADALPGLRPDLPRDPLLCRRLGAPQPLPRSAARDPPPHRRDAAFPGGARIPDPAGAPAPGGAQPQSPLPHGGLLAPHQRRRDAGGHHRVAPPPGGSGRCRWGSPSPT